MCVKTISKIQIIEVFVTKHSLSILAATFVASGCATSSAEDLGPPPSTYREVVAAHLKTTLFDPYSVRDAMISEPRSGRSLSGPKWNVCFRGNAKNRLGGYTGLKEILFVFEGEQIIATDSDYGAITCQGMRYSEFPELTY